MRYPDGKHRHFHFIGIGGIGMSALAYALASLGYKVSGSDKRKDFYTKPLLESQGVIIYQGHSASHVDDGVDIGVVSTAISADNEELMELHRRNISVVHRSQILGAFTKANTTVGITGAHGKTTVTYYLGRVLLDALWDPSIIIGATMKELEGNNVRIGGDLLVSEVDESDKSLLNTYPDYTVIHSIDIEHMDHYQSYDDIYNTMLAYARKTPWWGKAFLNIGYEDLHKMADDLQKEGYKAVTYSLASKTDLPADFIGNVKDRIITIYKTGEPLVSFTLQYPTLYNFENALAAFTVAYTLGGDPNVIAYSLEDAGLPGRRLEYKGMWRDAIVLEDYAHHPHEIEALLDGLRTMYPDKDIWGVIQPHRYTRLSSLWDEFRSVIAKFDRAFVMPVYAASEKPIDGITSERLVEGINSATFVDWESIVPAIIDEIAKQREKGKIIVLIGAGDVYKVWDLLRSE